MKAADIIKLKTDLCVRLDTLRKQLNLSDEDNYVPELDIFRLKTGFAKWWYFVKNVSRISAAAEYESLLQLINDVPKLTPEDQNLLDVFGNGQPGTDYQVQDKKTSNTVEELKNSLKLSLTSSAPSGAEKNAAIKDFWNKLCDNLSMSPAPADQIMSRYMQDRTDLGLKPAPIMMKEPETLHSAPSFFENLPSGGSLQDFMQAAKGHTTPVIIPTLQPTRTTPVLQVNIASTTKIFFFFSCTFLQDVENNVKQRKAALDEASEFLRNTRKMPSDYMSSYITQLKETIEQWKQAGVPPQPPRQQVVAPVNQSTAQQVLNYVAPYIPGVPVLKQTQPVQTVANAATATESSWLPSFPSLFGNSTTTAPQPTTPNQAQNNSWFSSLW